MLSANVTTRERVTAWLMATPGERLCAGCIARALGLGRKLVHEATVKLEADVRFKRLYAECAACKKVRIVTGCRPQRIAV